MSHVFFNTLHLFQLYPTNVYSCLFKGSLELRSSRTFLNQKVLALSDSANCDRDHVSVIIPISMFAIILFAAYNHESYVTAREIVVCVLIFFWRSLSFSPYNFEPVAHAKTSRPISSLRKPRATLPLYRVFFYFHMPLKATIHAKAQINPKSSKS